MAARRRRSAGILGDLRLNGQRSYWLDQRDSEIVFRRPRIYLGIVTMFGDPSLRLPARSGDRR